MGKLLGNVTIVASWLVGLYVGLWVMFIQPIMVACQAFDAGCLTGAMVGVTILKCIFAGCVGTIIGYAGTILGYWIKTFAHKQEMKKRRRERNGI